jgi:putative transposase
MSRGFVFLTAVVDVAGRKVLAHRVAITLEAEDAVAKFKEVVARHGSPAIVNTDQGSQYTAQDFVDAVHGANAKLSTDGRGAWRDNVFVERLWRSVKYERVYLKSYDGVSSAKAHIAGYLLWYNLGRPHSSLNQQMPDEAYAALLPKMLEAA